MRTKPTKPKTGRRRPVAPLPSQDTASLRPSPRGLSRIEAALTSVAVDEAEVAKRMWVRPSEDLVTWGSVYFDSKLRRLPYASDQAWLEARLIRDRDTAEHRALFEVRTRFDLFPKGRKAASGRKVIRLIAQLQANFARERGIEFPAFGSIKPYMLGPKGTLVRAHGKSSHVARAEEAIALYRAFEVIAFAWETCRRRSVRATRQTVVDYLRTELCRPADGSYEFIQEEFQDVARLFAPAAKNKRGEIRPVLSRPLVFSIGKALAYPAPEAAVQQQPRRLSKRMLQGRLERLVAEELARRHRLNARTVLRSIVQQALRGGLGGKVIETSEDHARKLRKSPSKPKARALTSRLRRGEATRRKRSRPAPRRRTKHTTNT